MNLKNPENPPLPRLIFLFKKSVGARVVLPHPDSRIEPLSSLLLSFCAHVGFDNDKTYKTWLRNSHAGAPAPPAHITLFFRVLSLSSSVSTDPDREENRIWIHEHHHC
jgi:hypothetical protein